MIDFLLWVEQSGFATWLRESTSLLGYTLFLSLHTIGLAFLGDMPNRRNFLRNESGLRHLVDEVGVDHIFYGTDYPFDWPVGIDFVLNARFLNDS